MATVLENLITRREAVALELSQLDMTKLGGMADIGGRDGGTDIKHQEYKMNLYRELEYLDGAIKRAQDVADGGDPFEVETFVDPL